MLRELEAGPNLTELARTEPNRAKLNPNQMFSARFSFSTCVLLFSGRDVGVDGIAQCACLISSRSASCISLSLFEMEGLFRVQGLLTPSPFFTFWLTPTVDNDAP